MIVPKSLISNANKVINVDGKVFYNDRRRRIDLKRPIRDLFENESLEVFYRMEICLSAEKTIERVKELAQKQVIPVIMYFMVKNE